MKEPNGLEEGKYLQSTKVARAQLLYKAQLAGEQLERSAIRGLSEELYTENSDI